jgi:hypothetical protein
VALREARETGAALARGEIGDGSLQRGVRRFQFVQPLGQIGFSPPLLAMTRCP